MSAANCYPQHYQLSGLEWAKRDCNKLIFSLKNLLIQWQLEGLFQYPVIGYEKQFELECLLAQIKEEYISQKTDVFSESLWFNYQCEKIKYLICGISKMDIIFFSQVNLEKYFEKFFKGEKHLKPPSLRENLENPSLEDKDSEAETHLKEPPSLQENLKANKCFENSHLYF